jgi:hypothetical protein
MLRTRDLPPAPAGVIYAIMLVPISQRSTELVSLLGAGSSYFHATRRHYFKKPISAQVILLRSSDCPVASTSDESHRNDLRFLVDKSWVLGSPALPAASDSAFASSTIPRAIPSAAYPGDGNLLAQGTFSPPIRLRLYRLVPLQPEDFSTHFGTKVSGCKPSGATPPANHHHPAASPQRCTVTLSVKKPCAFALLLVTLSTSLLLHEKRPPPYQVSLP